MKSLDVAMNYNYHLWMVHYIMHLEQIETQANIGDVTKLGKMEMAEMFTEAVAYSEAQQEIGNIAPQDLVENPVLVRLHTQFSWGSRYCPPFVHSNDSISSVVTTLQKLGK
jgi:adenosylmethionine-8-amino-7-oxononanoate aminotransferase